MEHIPKDKLIPGKRYKGHCRNATEALWDGTKFVYTRTKFGHSYEERICHPEDFHGFDVFYPRELIDS